MAKIVYALSSVDVTVYYVAMASPYTTSIRMAAWKNLENHTFYEGHRGIGPSLKIINILFAVINLSTVFGDIQCTC